MSAPRRAFRRFGLRWRITVAFVGGALAVSMLVAGITFVLVDRFLSDQRVRATLQQSYANVRFAVRYLAQEGAEENLDELVDLLEARGRFDSLIVQDPQWFSTSLSISPSSVPGALGRSVGTGHVAFAEDPGRHLLVFGSPIPGHHMAAYFFFSVEDLQAVLGLLGRVLLLVAGAAVVLAALAGNRVSTRVVHPVSLASDAARRVAEGLLETRLPVEGEDELGAMAHSFNEMAQALEERIRRERRFVGDVSHELRTPLTTLRTSTEYLLDHREELSPSLQRATDLLGADLEYLQRLVSDLLDMTRIEEGRADMRWERVNVGDLAREVVARRARAGAEPVRLQVDARPDELTTVADKQRLERVLGNLVDNAMTHGGGRDVTVRVGTDDGALVLSVEDHGPGIPSEVIHRIFERFVKADPARHRGDGRGSGLGLAIARENAHLHGGDITVRSAGRGARFTVRLPRRAGEPES